MNIIKPRLNQNRREHRFQLRKFCNSCAYAGFLILFACLISLAFGAEDTETEEPRSTANSTGTQTTENTAQETDTAENTDATAEMTQETITGTSKRMESYEQEGITCLLYTSPSPRDRTRSRMPSSA